MISNYLKIAFRSFAKQKVYAAINILGLATGIASCVLIVMYVSDESSYDSFHTKADRIYKVALERKYPTYSINYAVVPFSYGEVIQRDFAEVQAVVRMGGPYNNNGVSYQDETGKEKFFDENFIMAADSNFFKVFDIAILQGNATTALRKPFDIVLTYETAKRYFGDQQAIGKRLRIFDQDFYVSAICANVPPNSHMKFDFLFRWDEQFLHNGRPNFLGFSTHIYLLLKEDADARALENKFPRMVETYAAAQWGSDWEEYRRAGNDYRYFLQPLTRIHLDPAHIEGKIRAGGNQNYVYFLSCIAALILVIACINFMNLATAKSSERAREVGVRKTMGSRRSQLIHQFFVESFLVALLAVLIAIAFVYAMLPYFNNLTGKSLEFIFTYRMVTGLFCVTILVGLLAGSYPAFILSSFDPVQVLKGNFAKGGKGSSLRNSLVVFQFMISIILIAGTMVITRQMKYMQNKPLGYDKDHIIVVERIFALQLNEIQTFIDELERLPDIEAAGGSFSIPGGNRVGDYFGEQWRSDESTDVFTTKSMVMDDQFANAVGFEFVQGNGFSKETHDSLSVIINETAMKTFNLADPIGKKLTLTGQPERALTVIGVVKDFNFESLHAPITPLTIRSTESFQGGAAYAFARVKENNIPSALAGIEDLWNAMAPGQPFKYFFFDENLYAQYAREKQAADTFSVFSGLAIFIACVGLFGLAAHTATQRTKEIGIRKVLGATMVEVIYLLSKDFTKLILIAFILAVPLTWYVMNEWLQGFAYRIELSAGILVVSGLIALLISWVTVSYQSIKAALMNPVKSLRSE